MNAITYTQAKNNLAHTMDRVCQDRYAPIIIKRPKHPPVVIMSLDEYNSIEETMHVLRNTKNAARLRKDIDDFERSKGSERALKE